WFLLLFCFVWDGFLVFWYSMVFAMWNGNAGPIVLLPLLFPILHVTMGIGLTYTVLCTFVNRTTISVSYGELSVRHGPLFWPGTSWHMATDIKQLYCTDTWSRGKYGGSYTYNVMAVKSDDVRVKLISGLEELDDALFIEQEIEQHLKIRDE